MTAHSFSPIHSVCRFVSSIYAKKNLPHSRSYIVFFSWLLQCLADSVCVGCDFCHSLYRADILPSSADSISTAFLPRHAPLPLDRGHQTTVRLSKTSLLVLSLFMSQEALEIRPTLLYTVNRGNRSFMWQCKTASSTETTYASTFIDNRSNSKSVINHWSLEHYCLHSMCTKSECAWPMCVFCSKTELTSRRPTWWYTYCHNSQITVSHVMSNKA